MEEIGHNMGWQSLAGQFIGDQATANINARICSLCGPLLSVFAAQIGDALIIYH